MQEIVTSNKLPKRQIIDDLSPEDRQKLVGVFAWLIQEDKKQNPALYKLIKEK